ncbi:single-stranded DNA-binding protein [Clostridium argentinense]|nr:single-stranded DNA-binding protein [Clostridium argentinense]HAG43329.1 single-stranded DNA-binding protein [Clostridium sp.]ARC84022.1 single-stranded DNA-binding protein [Clostridium argentinense]NFF39372.1 single-stranded DNA-binding protein [Clostridium argentinense]NFP50423.1 single-stranded DNA-binding protein [Clostridium argentinense]NFP73353.1 single-stranded DNA-binding protein [Clostridium argentinense]
MNRIVLVGRITKKPEIKALDENSKVFTRIMLAVDRPYKTASGEKQVDFIPIVLWGKKAEIVCEYLDKNSMISVTGRLQTRVFENHEGQRKFISEVIADEFQFMSYKKQNESIG